jgi:hypothetical protein
MSFLTCCLRGLRFRASGTLAAGPLVAAELTAYCQQLAQYRKNPTPRPHTADSFSLIIRIKPSRQRSWITYAYLLPLMPSALVLLVRPSAILAGNGRILRALLGARS